MARAVFLPAARNLYRRRSFTGVTADRSLSFLLLLRLPSITRGCGSAADQESSQPDGPHQDSGVTKNHNESREVISENAMTLDQYLFQVNKLQLQGFDATQAVAVVKVMNDVLNHGFQENASVCFVSKAEVEEYNRMYKASLAKLQEDVQTSQDSRISSVYRDVEKLQTDISKLVTDMRLQMDKVVAGQRLDLNLERGNITKELKKQSAETSSMAEKLDREITALRAQLAASKYEVVKNCIGTIVSVYALAFALFRFFK